MEKVSEHALKAPSEARHQLFPDPGHPCGVRQGVKFSKFYERSQEVVENKGPRFRKAKRYMKTKQLAAESQEVVDGQRLIVFQRRKKSRQ
jgi:hypothetical protein